MTFKSVVNRSTVNSVARLVEISLCLRFRLHLFILFIFFFLFPTCLQYGVTNSELFWAFSFCFLLFSLFFFFFHFFCLLFFFFLILFHIFLSFLFLPFFFCFPFYFLFSFKFLFLLHLMSERNWWQTNFFKWTNMKSGSLLVSEVKLCPQEIIACWGKCCLPIRFWYITQCCNELYYWTLNVVFTSLIMLATCTSLNPDWICQCRASSCATINYQPIGSA